MEHQKTIILIHGAWVTPKCWDPLISFLEARGYRVIAPPWPGKERSIEEQRKNPDPKLATLGVKEIVDHYEKIIRAEQEPPILIGHSFGGLFVQMLLDRGVGACGVSIDSAPPKGVFAFYPSVIRGMGRPLATPFGWKRILRIPFSDFVYAFVHLLLPEEQRAVYDTYVVPESGRIFWQAAFSPVNTVTRVNFKNDNRAPLLLIAGGEDKTIPPQMNRENFEKYTGSKARTDFKEFPGRVHGIIVQKDWEEVAEFSEKWIREVLSK